MNRTPHSRPGAFDEFGRVARALAFVVASLALASCAAPSPHSAQGSAPSPEAAFAHPGTTRIVVVRHGEKPEAGLGMLTCQGLNRSLELPRALRELAGPPDVAMAPNPGAAKKDKGVSYSYNRPLLTIAPSAVAAGIPIDASIAWDDHEGLARALASPSLDGRTVYVAWEHHLALVALRDLYKSLGQDASELPKAWADDDFDSVYLVEIEGQGPSRRASFKKAAQRLSSLPKACPR